jgi:hypothetical protein
MVRHQPQRLIGSASAGDVAMIDDLRSRIAALQARFADVGARAARAAADVASGGAPPPEDLLAHLTATTVEFQRLRDDVLDSAASLELVLPKPADALVTLRDLVPVVDMLTAAAASAERHRRHEAGRAAALHVIDRVQAIVHHDDPAFAPLARCQALARAMHDEIAHAAATDRDVAAWAERLRPFADLLEMLEGSVDDDRFTVLADSVATSFGPPLATAAMRGRLVLR